MHIKLAMLTAAALLSVACSDRQQEATKSDMEKMEKKAERAIDNAGLTASVKTKLAADVRLSTLTSIHVESTGTVVTLTGRVPTAVDKRKAEATARSVDTVTSVINDLRVEP